MELPLSIRRVLIDAGSGATVIIDCTTGDAIVELEKAIEMYNKKFEESQGKVKNV